MQDLQGTAVRRAIKSALLSAAALAAVNVQVASAQTAAGGLDEIVVTATKRGQAALQDVPASIQAFGEEALTKMGVAEFTDFSRSVPGLDVRDTGPGQKRYLIRGANAPGEATVGVYYDEYPVTGSGQSAAEAGNNQPDIDLFDAERVEVLRGPQGTLYGAGAASGVIRMVTKRPDYSNFESHVQGTLSNTESGGNNWELKGMVNVPLIEDKFALRVVGYNTSTSGFIDNVPLGIKDINFQKRRGARVAAGVKFTDSTTWTTQVYYQQIESGGRNGHNPYDFTDVVGPPFLHERQPNGSIIPNNRFTVPAAGVLKQNTATREPYTEDLLLIGSTLESNFDTGSLTVAASLMDRSAQSYLDSSNPVRLQRRFRDTGLAIRSGELTGVPLIPPFAAYSDPATFISPTGLATNYQDQDTKMWTVEARYASNLSGRFNYLVGATYQHLDRDLVSTVLVANPATGMPDPAYASDNFLLQNRIAENVTKLAAVFGEVYFNATEKLELMAGARAFQTKRDQFSRVIIPFSRNPAIGGPAGVDVNIPAKEESVIGKLQATYRFTPDFLAYAQVSQGFRAGGVNSLVVPTIPPSFDADETRNYELGLKTSWLGSRLHMNLAAYRIDWYDMLINVPFTNEFNGLVNCQSSGPCAKIQGVEFELLARPIPGLDLGANVTFIDAHLTKTLANELPAGITTSDPVYGVSGDKLEGSPDYSGSAYAQFGWPVASGNVQAYLRGDLQFSSGAPTNSFSPVRNRASESYVFGNLKLGLENEKWGVALFVKNVTDKAADLTIFNNFQSVNRVTVNQPRTIGVTVDLRM
ncbi:MAG: TonB-dependent receptor [Steroidobacteraceae bacterium]